MKWQDRFIQEKTRMQTGINELNQLRYLIMMFFILETWKYTQQFKLSYWHYILGFILALIGFWLVGYIFDKLELYKAQAEFGNKRNKFVKEMREKIK